MKKLLVLSTITLGIFALVGIVSASPTESIQPASSLVVQDELQVLGTTRTYSIRIGAQGYGGVTFFNGTIINETTDIDTGAEMPVTFGDDVRVDGSLWRGETAGVGLDDNRELTVNDDMIVSGDLTVNDLLGTGIVNSTNILNGTIATTDIADNTITSAKINNGTIASADIANDAITSAKIAAGTIVGSDISSSADLSVATGTFSGAVTTGALTSSTGTFSGDIAASGDINQDSTAHGVAKALIILEEDGTCPTQWTYNDSSVTCDRTDEGDFTVTFEFDVYARYTQLTELRATPHIISYNVLAGTPMVLYLNSTTHDGTDENTNFVISVF